MKRLTTIAALFLLAPAPLTAQYNLSNRLSHPTPPSREALERLNLKMAWRSSVSMDGKRDGIFNVQMLGEQLVVQTRSGALALINCADGSSAWQTRLGATEYRIAHPVAYNSTAIFTTRGTMLYAVNRETGQTMWEFDLPNVPSTAPAADEDRIYLPLGTGSLYVYQFPRKPSKNDPAGSPELATTLKAAADTSDPRMGMGGKQFGLTAVGPYHGAKSLVKAMKVAPPQPEFLWDYLADARLEQTPIMTEDLLVLAGTEGTFFVMSKYRSQVPFQFPTGVPLDAPLAQYSTLDARGRRVDFAYIPSRNSNLYALDVLKGTILWRFTGGSAISRKPSVTDEDVYVVPDHAGLFRIDRNSGDTLWRNRACHRFLATNKKFVYAVDRSGQLLILDKMTGVERAAHDTRDFVVPITNDMTDRLFLASNDGLIVCLHDRDYVEPLKMKTMLEKPEVPAQSADKKPGDMPADKKPGAMPADKGEGKKMEMEKEK